MERKGRFAGERSARAISRHWGTVALSGRRRRGSGSQTLTPAIVDGSGWKSL
jgi:hypothetical protein